MFTSPRILLKNF